MRPVLRIWFVFLMIFNGVLLVQACLKDPADWVSAASWGLMAIAALLLLLTQRKAGFYLMCLAVVVCLAGILMVGGDLRSTGVSAAMMPVLTFLLMKKDWNSFR